MTTTYTPKPTIYYHSRGDRDAFLDVSTMHGHFLCSIFVPTISVVAFSCLPTFIFVLY